MGFSWWEGTLYRMLQGVGYSKQQNLHISERIRVVPCIFGKTEI